MVLKKETKRHRVELLELQDWRLFSDLKSQVKQPELQMNHSPPPLPKKANVWRPHEQKKNVRDAFGLAGWMSRFCSQPSGLDFLHFLNFSPALQL